jgi:hypothetical protein
MAHNICGVGALEPGIAISVGGFGVVEGLCLKRLRLVGFADGKIAGVPSDSLQDVQNG